MTHPTLCNFFAKHKITVTEGNIGVCNQQYNEIMQIINDNKSRLSNIMEVGFNAGHSAELFLQHTNAYVYSFDLGIHFHQYLKHGKRFINTVYPNRHTLVLGDSTKMIPNFIKNNNNAKIFDLIFIDGGHDYDIAMADIVNSKQLANENTILIVDDIIKTKYLEAEHTIGPTAVWEKLVNENFIIETSYSEYSAGHGQCVGKYVF
jgi:predicted O-methyltransferase YrrM